MAVASLYDLTVGEGQEALRMASNHLSAEKICLMMESPDLAEELIGDKAFVDAQRRSKVNGLFMKPRTQMAFWQRAVASHQRLRTAKLLTPWKWLAAKVPQWPDLPGSRFLTLVPDLGDNVATMELLSVMLHATPEPFASAHGYTGIPEVPELKFAWKSLQYGTYEQLAPLTFASCQALLASLIVHPEFLHGSPSPFRRMAFVIGKRGKSSELCMVEKREEVWQIMYQPNYRSSQDYQNLSFHALLEV